MKLWNGSVALVVAFLASPMAAQVASNGAVDNPLEPNVFGASDGKPSQKKTIFGEGDVSLGLWYAQAEGASLSLGFNKSKFFSTDEMLHFGLEASAYTQTLDISLTDSDFFGTAYTRRLGFSLYNAHPNRRQNGDYTFSGGETSIGLGRKISDAVSISFGIGTGAVFITDHPALPVFISAYIDENGVDNASAFGYFNISYEKTDDSVNPKKGLRFNVSNELGSVSGTSYIKSEGSISRFSNPFGSVDLNLHGSFARAESLNGGSFPIFESYYAGGPSSLRGFAQNTLGPTSAIPNSTERAYTGGKLRVLGGVEISAPVGQREEMHLLTFLDMGNVFGDVGNLNAADLRGALGIGMRWDSPVGPLSVTLAQPLNAQIGDQTEQVQFTLGASF